MREYRFSAYAATQIGLMASYRYGQLIIRVPFADIHISFNKYAKGVSIFGKEIFWKTTMKNNIFTWILARTTCIWHRWIKKVNKKL